MPDLHNQACPACGSRYADMLDHIRKQHPFVEFTDLQLQPIGLISCPICHTACRSQHGVRTHQAKVHGIQGTSNISTLPRTRTGPFQPNLPSLAQYPPARAQARQPNLTSNYWASQPTSREDAGPLGLAASYWAKGSRKRPAHSPPRASQQACRRQRQYQSPSPIRAGRARSEISDSESSLPGINSLGPQLPDPTPSPEPFQSPSLSPISPSQSQEASEEGSPPPELGHSRSPSRSLHSQSPSQSPDRSHSQSPSHSPGPSPSHSPSPSPSQSHSPGPSRSHSPSPMRGSSWSPVPAQGSLDQSPAASPDPPWTPEPTLEQQHAQVLQPILEKPAIQQLIAFSKIPVPEKRLHARQSMHFISAAKRAAEAFLARPTEKALLHFLLLPRILGLGIQQGQLAATLKAFPAAIPPIDPTQQPLPSPHQPSPVKQAIKHLENGYLGKAAKALYDTAPIAPDTAENREILRQKHPIGLPNPFRTKARPAAGQPITIEAIESALTSIGKEKAPGLSGWTRPLLDLAIRENTTLSFLRLLADMIRQGTAPGSDLLCAARLIGLEKADGGIRPIAIGDIVYRTVMKAILISLFTKNMLLPNQLGVNNPGGVEPAIFLLEEAISGPNKAKIAKIASLDLSNAFNSTPRASIAASLVKYAPAFYKASAWAYNKPSVLVTPTGATLASAEGARQGDPFGPFLFSLAFRPTLEHLQRQLPDATFIAYLDDVYILRPRQKKTQSPAQSPARSPTQSPAQSPARGPAQGPEEPILATVAQAFKESPLTLNLSKSKEYWIGNLKARGLKALGTFIGPQKQRRDFLSKKIQSFKEALSSLVGLPKQYTFLLAKGSLQLLLRHLLRQLDPTGLEGLWAEVDYIVQQLILSLATRDPSEPDLPSPAAQDLISLPVKSGGIGLLAFKAIAKDTYQAVKLGSQAALGDIYPNQAFWPIEPPKRSAKAILWERNRDCLLNLQAALEPQAQQALLENSSYLGRQWLVALPTQKQLILSDSETTEALRTRLLVPIRPLETPCSFCGNLPTLGHQDLCKAAERRWTSRHNRVSRAIINQLHSRASLEVESEPLTSPDPLGPRADFSICLNGSRYFYDLQIVAISKASAKEDAFRTLREAAEEKARKYKALGPYFRPLIISAGGLFEKEAASFYKEIQKAIGPVASFWLDRSISFILTKARAQAAASISREAPRNRNP